MLLVLLNWRALPAQVTENFRGGTLGAQGVAFAMIGGFLGLLLLIWNAITRRWEWLALRVVGFLLFLIICVFLGTLA